MAEGARPPGIELVHDVGPAAERRQRIAAADDLAQRREVGPDPEPALRPVRPDPERDDLVEHEQGADPVGDLAQPGQERRIGGADAARTLHGLDEDGGDVVLDGAEDALHAVRVAPRQLDDEARDLVRDAGGPGLHRVVRAVVRVVERRHEGAAR